MKGLDTGVEIVQWHGIQPDQYCYVEMAVNGIPTGTFSFPATHFDLPMLKTEEQLGQFLSRSAKTMLTRYGANGQQRPEATTSDLMSTVA